MLCVSSDMEALQRRDPDGTPGPEPSRAVLGGGSPAGVPRRAALRPGVAEPQAADVEGGRDAERPGQGASPADPAPVHRCQGVEREERRLRVDVSSVELGQDAVLAEPALGERGGGQVNGVDDDVNDYPSLFLGRV